MSWRRIRRRPQKKPDAKEYEQKKQALETLKTQEDQGRLPCIILMKTAFVYSASSHVQRWTQLFGF